MKVGDYVRTKHYGITKILKIYNNTTTNYCSVELDKTDSFGRLGVSVSCDTIIKSSQNIIDLIEVGDYVNGCMVINKKDDTIQIIQLIIPFDLKEKDIKSIVTKEQFESMEYKIN